MKSLEERNTLLKENMGLIHHVVNRFKRSTGDEEECKSLAMIAFDRAVQNFNPKKGKFSAYAYRCMKYALVNFYRDLWLRPMKVNILHPLSYDSPIPSHSGFDTLESITDNILALLSADIPTSREEIIQNEDYELLSVLISSLPPRTRTIIEERYFKGKTLREVEKVVGVTFERVRQIEKETLKWLKTELSKEV